MKKLSDEKKAIIIYSGELFLFAVIFAVLGTLKLTHVLGYSEKRRIVFNWITLFGGCWGIADFIWAICSKKRQKRISLFDKIITLPLPIYIIIFDLISLIAKPANDNFYIVMLSIAFLYVSADYLAQGIYHIYRPIPGFLELDDKAPGEENKEETIPEDVSESKEEEPNK